MLAPSVPRLYLALPASSTVGTVGRTCAGACRVTRSSSLSCVSFRPSSPSAVIHLSSLSSHCLRCHMSSVLVAISPLVGPPRPGTLLLSARCHPSVVAVIRHLSSAHLRRHLSSVLSSPPSSPHVSPIRHRRRRRKNVRYFRRCRHRPVSVLPFARRRCPSLLPVNCPPTPPTALAAPAQNMSDIPDAAVTPPLINCT